MSTWPTERGRPFDKRQHKSGAPLVKSIILTMMLVIIMIMIIMTLFCIFVFLHSDVYFPDLSFCRLTVPDKLYVSGFEIKRFWHVTGTCVRN